MLYPLIPLHVEKAWELVPSHLKSDDAVYKLGWFEPKAEWQNEEVADMIKFLDGLQEPTQMILTQTLKRRYARSWARSLQKGVHSQFMGGSDLPCCLRLSKPRHLPRSSKFPF